MKTPEHTKRHTTPPNPRPRAKVHQRVSCHAGGRHHPPQRASRHPQTRAPQRLRAVSDPRSGDGPGTPRNGLPDPSEHTSQHTTCVCDCAATRHAAQEPHWCLDCDCPAFFSQSAMGQIR